MAIKFSQFNLRTDHTEGMYLVGYDGNQNIHITVDNLFDDFINGTENTIAMFGTDGIVLADSILSQDAGATLLTVAGQLNVDADATFDTSITVTGDSTLNGNVILGDASTDLITQTGTLYLNGPIKDTTDTLGAVDQVLLSDATGELTFTDLADLHVGGAEVVEVPVKNMQGSALVKGDPVYISGSVGASGRLEVQLADASNTLKMPAVGLLKQDLADNAEGFAVVTGKLRNLITDPIDGVNPVENDVIYVKPSGISGAALTTTKPVYGNFIQNIGKVGRVSTAADGNFVVSSILRTNDIPNLTPGRLWVGSTGNTIESQTLFVDEANGRLGIGTALPATPLDVNGDITSRGDIIIDAAIGDPFLKLKTPAQEYVLRIDRSDNEKFQIRDITNSATRVTLDTSGNIGSGTTTPFAKLHIKDEVNNPGILIESSQATGANFQNSYINLRAQETSTNTNASGSIILHGANTLNAAGPKTLQIRNLSFGGADVLITTYDNTNTALNPARFKSSGQVQFEEYGSGTFTGTAAKNLAVDLSGNVIEIDPLANIVETITTTDGTYINLTPNSATDGDVTITADLSATGTPDATKYLRGDNTWATITGVYDWDISDGVNLPDTIANGETVTFAGGTYLTTTYAAATNTLTIDHDATTRNDTASADSPGYGGTFTIVSQVNTNATGHVIGVDLESITMPSAENYTWSLDGDSGTAQTINSGDTVDIAGGTYINTVVGATDTVTVNHDETTRTDTTSSDTPGYGGTFTVVDSVTTNVTGHLEAINVKTVTMPSADDTNTTYDLSGYGVNNGASGIQLVGSDSTTDQVAITGAGTTLVTHSGNTITVTSNDQYTGTVTGSGTASVTGGQIPYWDATTNITGTTELNYSTVAGGTIGVLGIGNNSIAFGNSRLVVGSGSGGALVTLYGGGSNSNTIAFANGTSGNAQYRGQVKYNLQTDSLEFLTNGETFSRVYVDSAFDFNLVERSLNFRNSFPYAVGAYIDLPTDNELSIGTNGSEHIRVDSSGNVGVGTDAPNSKLQVDGSVQVANDTDTASADKVGALRYYTSGNNSYVDMVMQTGASTYAWVNIVQNNW